MASTKKGSFTVSMSDAWARNERMIQRMNEREGRYEGTEKAPKTKVNVKGKDVEITPNAVLGLDSDLFHQGGQMVNFLKEERLNNGNIRAYHQVVQEDGRSGGTYYTEWEQVGDRRYKQVTKPRKYYSF